MKYFVLAALVFISGCSNGLNPGERYCVAGMEAYYVGGGHSVADTKFITNEGKALWVFPESVRRIEHCGE